MVAGKYIAQHKVSSEHAGKNPAHDTSFLLTKKTIKMTPKEKAKQLIDTFYRAYPIQDNSLAKTNALIMVNERLEELNFTHIGYGKMIMQGYQKTKNKYWRQVKVEIENYDDTKTNVWLGKKC